MTHEAEIKEAAEARIGADRMEMGLSCIPNSVSGDMDEVRRLRAEVAALKKDAERLDRIESMARQKQVQIAQSLLKTGYEIAVGMSVAVHHGSLREALDAALSSAEKT